MKTAVLPFNLRGCLMGVVILEQFYEKLISKGRGSTAMRGLKSTSQEGGGVPMFSADFTSLFKAYLQCRKKKRLKRSAAEFEFNLEPALFALENNLRNRSYQPVQFIAFVVTVPRVREIFAAAFKDRVVHHLLYFYLLPVFEPKFIDDSYACRPGKGTHKAVKRLVYFLKINHAKKHQLYYLQADIASFFCSINHSILIKIIQKQTKNPDIIWLAQTIINFNCASNPIKYGQLSLFAEVPPEKSLFNARPGIGLPIGNLTSQFFANVYLNELDQYVKHTLKCKYYIRYVDDFIILADTPEKLLEIKQKIADFLKKRLALKLHPRKCIIKEIDDGIDFLGYFIKPTHVLVRKRVVVTFKKKLASFQNDNLPLEYKLACINSYYAHFRHANSYNLRKHLWEEHFGILKKDLMPVDDYRYFKLK